MIVIGIDPGKNGALCAMEDGKIIDLIDMPEDLTDLCSFWPSPDARAFIEKVGGLPRQSAARAFAFGFHCGHLYRIAYSYSGGMEPTYVTPQRWKGDLRCPKDKKQAQARASELMPDEAWRWPLVKHDGRAEAAMIALWGTIHG